MRIVLQRVSRASVRVDAETVGEIAHGLLILIGVREGDDEGKMNRSVDEVGGALLVVSQFTLYGDVRKGRRPSFNDAARPELAEPLVEAFAASLEALGVRVARGRFGAHMQVELVNDGPVTLVIDSEELDRPRHPHRP